MGLSKKNKRKTRKGGHPKSYKLLAKERIDVCHGADCVPQTLYQLGYLTKEVANHLSELALDTGTTEHDVTLFLLDEMYGVQHYFYDASTNDRIMELLKNNNCTIGSYIPYEGAEYSHYVVVCHIMGHIFIVDPQNTTRKIGLDNFFKNDPHARSSLSIVNYIPLSYEEQPPIEITIDDINRIVQEVKERRGGSIGGVVHGVGMKGKVIDYGAKETDMYSLEHIKFENVDHVDLYVLINNTIQKETKDASILYDIIHHDKERKYVVKEFMEPSIVMKARGMTKHAYMMREIDGFSHILPLFKKHNITGIKYRNTTLFGIEIFMKQVGQFYDSKVSRCFVINRKCQETMTMKKVDLLKPNQFIAFVKHILSELADLQQLNLAHGDIKLDNIMKCNEKYELIDWENSRMLNYEYLVKQRYLGLSPMYFKILYGSAWYPAFSTALLKYYQETGGYDTYTSSEYANTVVSHYSDLFSKHSTEEVFEKVKYELDLTAFGFILYGIMIRNPMLKKYDFFIMNLFKMKNARNALHTFSKLNKTRRN